MWLQTKVGRPVHATLEGILCVVDVELCIRGSKDRLRQKGADPMHKCSMKLEDPRAPTIIQAMVQLSSYRGHGQSIVVILDVITKFLCPWIFRIREKVI